MRSGGYESMIGIAPIKQFKGGAHMKKLLYALTACFMAGLFFAAATAPAIAAELGPPEVSWDMASPDLVRFHLRFSNPDPLEPTLAVSGQIYSQEFGVFLPTYGLIGNFDVPPIEPESFFDVFFEVPLGDLPPNPGGGVVASGPRAQVVECPPPIWVGNVDVTWAGPGGAGHVNAHFGNIGVCPGGASSCLHVLTGCGGNLVWAINNPCPGWNMTLENEDHTAAPAALPSGWTGWICVSAGANIQPGAQCCFSVDFWCAGVKATINACAFACPCPVGVEQHSWGGIKQIYR
jgi:hypothetical protein